MVLFRIFSASFLLLLISPLPAFAAAGDLDTSFNPGAGANDGLYTSVVQTDGKIIIGGLFTAVNGVARNYIARLNADGSLDTGFNPGTGANNDVMASTVQTDGKILIGGTFTTVNGVGRKCIARLNADGSLDASFNPGAGAGGGGTLFSYVSAIVVQPGGKVVIGGAFTNVNSTARNYLARLNANGSLDTGFNANLAGISSSAVQTAVMQADGKIIIGGSFTSVHGVAHNRIARLNADGSLDTDFNPGTGTNGYVWASTLQADGKIVIGGGFTTVNGVARSKIARLNADGSLDSSFDPGTGPNNIVRTITAQADGKIIIGGSFITVNDVARNYIARLNADGSLDSNFNSEVNASVWTSAAQADGKIIIGGSFITVNDVARNHIARIHTGDNVASADNDFNNNGTADVLLRAASSGAWRLFTMTNGVADNNTDYPLYNGNDWKLVASEDFDANGETDLLLRNTSTGAWRIFMETGAIVSNSNFGAYANTAWEVASVADYNGDGTKDVLLHSNAGGGWRVFYINNGATTTNANMALYASGWDLKYDGDTDGDGDADIILRRASDGYWRQFTIQGGVVASNSATGLYQSLDWQIQFVSDLDNDGDDDIVMRSTTGNNWRTFAVSSGAVGANSKLSMYENAAWSFNHLNDVDADGDEDIVLRSNAGGWRLFLTDGLDTPANSALALYANSAWVKADVADVNGDGTNDVILNNTSTGAWRAFMISGAVVSSDTNPGLYQNVDWTLQNK